MKTKKIVSFLGCLFSVVLCAAAMCSGCGILIAPTGVNPETGQGESAGSGVQSTEFQNHQGITSISTAEGMVEYTDESTGETKIEERKLILSRNLMRKVREVFPANTVVAQILSYAPKEKVGGMEFEYSEVNQRALATKLATAVSAATPGASATTTKIVPVDLAAFSADDTIYFPDVPAVTKPDGTAYDSSVDAIIPCLEVKVSPDTENESDGVKVYAVNGIKNSAGQPVLLPAISQYARMLRGAKTVNELAAQTGRWTAGFNLVKQYCRKLMLQLEESTLYKLTQKDVDWDMSRNEKMAVYDYKCAKEVTSLFGSLGKLRNLACEKNNNVYFSKGIWWSAGKDLELGHWDATLEKAVISDDDLVDFNKSGFTGTGIKSTKKLLIGGSELIAELGKVRSDKFRLMDTVEAWNLKFKAWETDFGEIMSIHDEFFDLYGMSDYALLLDPEHLSWGYLLDLDRKHIDLKMLGVRDAEALVFTEVGAPILYYPNAHARVRLAQAPESPEPEPDDEDDEDDEKDGEEVVTS